MKKLLAFLLLLMLSGTPALADSPTFGGGGWGIQASCATITQNGVGCWDNDNFIFYIGNGTSAQAIGGTGYFANPMSAVGDIIYGGTAGAATRLAPNTAATTKYLQQIGTGSAGQAPTWAQVSLTAGVTSTLPVANGGWGSTDGSFAGAPSFTGAVKTIPGTTTPVLIGNTTPINTSTSATFATADKTQIDKTGAFTDAAVGDLIIVTGGTGATTGLYRLTTRTSADSVKVDRNIHASGTDITDGAFTVYKDVIAVTPTDGTNGQMITSYSHQDHPLQLGGSYLVAPAADATANAVIIPDIHFFGGSRIVDSAGVGNMYISGKGQITFSTGSTIAAQRWNILSTGHLVANNDNTYNIGASGATRPKDIYMAGVLYGNRNYVVTKSTNATLTEAEVQNSIIRVTGAATLILPAVSAALVGSRFKVVTVGAIAVSVDANASDRIILSGTALADGNKITNSSTAGDEIEIWCDSTDGWSTSNPNGVWIDGGA